MAFMKLNGFLNSAVLAMSDSRGLNDIIEMLKADPRAIDTLTMSEKTLMILFVAGLGMAVTFAVLVFLWITIVIMTKVFATLDKSNAKPAKVQEVTPAVAVEDTEVEEEEDEELIAVIAAAIAASLNTSIHNIVVKNVVRTNDHSPSWAKTGRIEQMNTRF
jgi:sodium pump decarboxylase gamma subunit